ncbi:hypothetical protein GALMADRAFT_136349 [Galerina marginata CBS 339.88]|uniref:Uncharacterized protein n=1 Tax=Galerina marginata (strain CBS 339.88) TaxID=685588 RepID=A0A067T9A8_GALM3|nr:hypothetical protein GALMADRAFT_136349 [Galerina marginata CBS 339.88]
MSQGFVNGTGRPATIARQMQRHHPGCSDELGAITRVEDVGVRPDGDEREGDDGGGTYEEDGGEQHPLERLPLQLSREQRAVRPIPSPAIIIILVIVSSAGSTVVVSPLQNASTPPPILKTIPTPGVQQILELRPGRTRHRKPAGDKEDKEKRSGLADSNGGGRVRPGETSRERETEEEGLVELTQPGGLSPTPLCRSVV